MRILIIGAGAVGCFIGARLALGGHEVTLAGRPALVGAARSAGLTLREPEGERSTGPLAAHTSLREAFAHASYDLAVLTVKAYDTAQAIAELRRATDAAPPILSLQNGVGNEEALALAFGAACVVAGAIETPLSMPAPGLVVAHRARYRAGIAPVAAQSPAVLAGDALERAGIRVDRFADYRRLKWSKLLLNLPANASCAILDWTPAQVMADPVAAALDARAWQEAFRVMAALRIRPVALAGYPLPVLAPIVRVLPPAWLARGLARTVSGGRGSKAPSLLVALAAGKPSEVAWLNGVVAEAGETHGVPVPVNRAFTDTLVALSSGAASRDAWRGSVDRLASAAGG